MEADEETCDFGVEFHLDEDDPGVASHFEDDPGVASHFAELAGVSSHFDDFWIGVWSQLEVWWPVVGVSSHLAFFSTGVWSHFDIFFAEMNYTDLHCQESLFYSSHKLKILIYAVSLRRYPPDPDRFQYFQFSCQ